MNALGYAAIDILELSLLGLDSCSPRNAIFPLTFVELHFSRLVLCNHALQL